MFLPGLFLLGARPGRTEAGPALRASSLRRAHWAAAPSCMDQPRQRAAPGPRRVSPPLKVHRSCQPRAAGPPLAAAAMARGLWGPRFQRAASSLRAVSSCLCRAPPRSRAARLSLVARSSGSQLRRLSLRVAVVDLVAAGRGSRRSHRSRSSIARPAGRAHRLPPDCPQRLAMAMLLDSEFFGHFGLCARRYKKLFIYGFPGFQGALARPAKNPPPRPHPAGRGPAWGSCGPFPMRPARFLSRFGTHSPWSASPRGGSGPLPIHRPGCPCGPLASQ